MAGEAGFFKVCCQAASLDTSRMALAQPACRRYANPSPEQLEDAHLQAAHEITDAGLAR